MRRQRMRRIFAVPFGLALLSAIGLVAALVGDGGWDALSWITLAVPVAVCIYYPIRRSRTARLGARSECL